VGIRQGRGKETEYLRKITTRCLLGRKKRRMLLKKRSNLFNNKMEQW